MSDRKYSLQGRLVELFLLGDCKFSGRVEYVSDDKLILSGELGPLVIYKDKIVAALLLKEEDFAKNEEISHEVPNSDRSMDEEFYRSGESYYGSVIPGDMLVGNDEDVIPTSFSLSMSDLRSPKSKEEKYGSSKKDEEDRGENKG